jgi:hypothetical protein
VVVQVGGLQDGYPRIPSMLVSLIVPLAVINLCGKRHRNCKGGQDESGNNQFVRSGFHIVLSPLVRFPTVTLRRQCQLHLYLVDHFNLLGVGTTPIPPSARNASPRNDLGEKKWRTCSASVGKYVWLLRDTIDGVNQFLGILLCFAYLQAGCIQGRFQYTSRYQLVPKIKGYAEFPLMTNYGPYNKPICLHI